MKQQSNKNNLDAPWLEQMRQEMSDCTDFGTTLPADGWDKIAAKVNGPSIAPAPEKKRRKPLIIWLSAAASFLLLIGVGTAYLISDGQQKTTDHGQPSSLAQNEHSELEQQATPEVTLTEPNVTTEPTKAPACQPMAGKPAGVSTLPKTIIPVRQELLAETTPTIPEPVEETTPVKEVEQVIEQHECIAVIETPMPTEEEAEQLIESYKAQLKQAEDEVLLAMQDSHASPSQDFTWHLGLAMDGSSSFDSETAAETPKRIARYESISTQRLTRATDGQYVKPIIKHALPEDVEKSDHHRSYSFGITVSKNVTQRLSLQSGLVATTLLSDITLYNKNQMQQRVQYLGIPLQLNVSLYETTHWQIYASAGGRVDQPLKCKRAGMDIECKQLQWSASTALGVQYMFTRRIGLYAEPHLSYYFDNGTSKQTPTLFTEHPLNFNLQAGLKIRL